MNARERTQKFKDLFSSLKAYGVETCCLEATNIENPGLSNTARASMACLPNGLPVTKSKSTFGFSLQITGKS